MSLNGQIAANYKANVLLTCIMIMTSTAIFILSCGNPHGLSPPVVDEEVCQTRQTKPTRHPLLPYARGAGFSYTFTASSVN